MWLFVCFFFLFELCAASQLTAIFMPRRCPYLMQLLPSIRDVMTANMCLKINPPKQFRLICMDDLTLITFTIYVVVYSLLYPPSPQGEFSTLCFSESTLKKLSNHVFCYLEVEAFVFYAMFNFIALNIQFLRFNNEGTHRKLKISQSFLILDH